MEDDERVAKMDADEFYKAGGGKYLKGADIKGLEWEVTIKDAFEDQDFNGKPCIAITFNEIEQQLTLNKTNYSMVKENTGSSETKNWVGKKLTLFGTRDLNPQGVMVDVVRVRPPEREVKRVTPGKSGDAGLPNDKIPF
jgi:hypothetical protein